MITIIAWALALAISLAALILTAGAGGLANLAVAAAAALALAGLALIEHRRLAAAAAPPAERAARDARSMTLVWAWGALAIATIYGFVLKWPEWWMFFAGFSLAAVASAAFARALATGLGDDDPLLRLARILCFVQAAGMVATIVGLLVDRKMTRYLNPAKYPDWVANNVFFCGAAALLVISIAALRSHRTT